MPKDDGKSAVAHARAALALWLQTHRFQCSCEPRELRAEPAGLVCAFCDRPIIRCSEASHVR